MKCKKLLNILHIFTFFIVLLLVCLNTSTSYADDYKIWTENQIKNVIYNYGIGHQQSDTQMRNFISNIESYITQITNDFNNSHNNAIFLQPSANFSNMVFLSQNNTTGGWYFYNNRLRATNTSDCKYYIIPTSRNTLDEYRLV